MYGDISETIVAERLLGFIATGVRKMARHTTKPAIALLTFAIGVLVALPLTILQTPSHGFQQRECLGWQKSDVADQGLGWDLTYRSVLDRVGFCPGQPLCDEWAKPQPPIHKHFAEWQGDPIVSSMEIELFDGHAGMDMIWLIRTRDHAYYWLFDTSDISKVVEKDSLSPQLYDQAFNALACWHQNEPKFKTFGPEGYLGFLSLYREGRYRQILLTYKDLIEESSFAFFKEHDDRYRYSPGRFSIIISPVLTSIEGK